LGPAHGNGYHTAWGFLLTKNHWDISSGAKGNTIIFVYFSFRESHGRNLKGIGYSKVKEVSKDLM